MNLTLKPTFGLSGSALKVIAMISMVIDHIALYLMEHGTLIAEGVIHTRSRYRYFFTLLGFAVISEIPWYLLNGADGTHNVMFTLALGVATLMVLENLLQRSMVLGFLWTLGMAGLASWLGVDYEWRGILIIVIFYLYNILLNIDKNNRYSSLIFCYVIMSYYGIIGTIFAIYIIYLYNTFRGFINMNTLKYIFYLFYPLHLYILLFFT